MYKSTNALASFEAHYFFIVINNTCVKKYNKQCFIK